MPSKSTIVAIIICVVAYFIFPALSTGVIIGTLIGWNVLEQPAIVRKYWDMLAAKLNL